MMSGYRAQSVTRTCECGNDKPKRAACCTTCQALDAVRTQAGELRTRVATTLRHFDWCEGTELRDILGIDVEHEQYDTLNSVLYKLVRRGVLETRKVRGMGTSYRLTEQKRRAA